MKIDITRRLSTSESRAATQNSTQWRLTKIPKDGHWKNSKILEKIFELFILISFYLMNSNVLLRKPGSHDDRRSEAPPDHWGPWVPKSEGWRAGNDVHQEQSEECCRTQDGTIVLNIFEIIDIVQYSNNHFFRKLFLISYYNSIKVSQGLSLQLITPW